ncbi:hypothetical protein ACIQXV_01840 [Neobacillus sp. NPDC097160]|uniref:hypothetical protein n=1 Tax=Neobacillus sp. NPDC097160 TaxID=3364298 RepID=UPI003820C712
MLIDEERANRLHKSILIEEISSHNMKLKKTELFALFLEKIDGNDLLQLGIIKKYPAIFALHPSDLEELLGITKSERIRWTKEANLPVEHYESFRKWGQTLEYPMYNYYEAIQIVHKGLIEKWRKAHNEKVAKNRKASARIAVKTRKQNRLLVKSFYEDEWKTLLKQWYKEDQVTGATLQLAFWTMWVNRFAKEMQLKERRAVKKAVEYREKKELFYQLKEEALNALMNSPLSKLQFYRPESPDKISDLQFCEHHYNLWVLARKYDYISKWEYFSLNEKEIRKCPSCTFSTKNDYYSLFYLSICSGEFKFSFHTPYPIGKEKFPDPTSLERVVHEEQEGLFRFGRGLFDEEKIIFTEMNILNFFKESLEKYNITLHQQYVLS